MNNSHSINMSSILRNSSVQECEHELKLYMNMMAMRQRTYHSTEVQKKPSSGFSDCRVSHALFVIWSKYQPLIPQPYYEEKVLEMGEFLVSIKEYRIALWQCYSRYLQNCDDLFDVDENTDAVSFKRMIFPNGCDERKTNDSMFRALIGRCICAYEVLRMADPKLANKENVVKCIDILCILRLILQVVLPHENLCWLVYNGTIHIYTISRHLMSLGHSAKVVKFLLWAVACMEASVPLLSVKFLAWRSTLYTAVCQCYYDCKAGQHAEAFARRCLAKINELSQLECHSNSPDFVVRELAFRHAAIKIGIMIYKRSAFESRRKSRGFRSRTGANLKEVMGLLWPRTISEKALVEMFDGTSAQFLCILETLMDSSRRTLITSPPASNIDTEILDLYAELFLAGREIIMGGGAVQTQVSDQSTYPALAGVVHTKRSLMDMAGHREDGVTIPSLIKFIKLAYSYEYFDLFMVLAENTKSFLRGIDERIYDTQIIEIELMQAVLRLSSAKKTGMEHASPPGDSTSANQNEKPNDPEDVKTSDDKEKDCKGAKDDNGDQEEDDKEKEEGHKKTERQAYTGNDEGDSGSGLVDIMNLAGVVLRLVDSSHSHVNMDHDILMDCAFIFWNKCKAAFQKYQTGCEGNTRYISKMKDHGKWLFLLHLVHRFVSWSNLREVDPVLCADIALRCAYALESSSSVNDAENERSAETLSETPHPTGSLAPTWLRSHNPRKKLQEAKNILELGLENVSVARQQTALSNGHAVADVSCVKELHAEVSDALYQKRLQNVLEKGNASTACDERISSVEHLHLELIYLHHRVAVKLLKASEEEAKQKAALSKMSKIPVIKSGKTENFDALVSGCGKSSLSKALLYMQKAVMLGTGCQPSGDQENLAKKAASLISRAQVEERRLYVSNHGVTHITPPTTPPATPPAPILLCRTHRTMTFTPAPFSPKGEQVVWYRLFGKPADGVDVKVRLNDDSILGCGIEVPARQCELLVTGLKPNERYLFAVAAYNAVGQLIGDGPGESTLAILASPPLPVMGAWAFLAQAAYQIGSYTISRQACSVLWEHFVTESPPDTAPSYTNKNPNDCTLILHRLNGRLVSKTSPVLLRQFLNSLFISVAIQVKENRLNCDALCDRGPLYRGQAARLAECERLLVGLELAGWLNESNIALQACVQCYGLLLPFIHHKIQSVNVLQVLERCHVFLQEIPVSLRHRRQMSTTESLHHMIACTTFYLVRVLRIWQQRQASTTVNESGRKLLSIDVTNVDVSKREQGDTVGGAAAQPKKRSTFPVRNKKRNKDQPGSLNNEELKALEAHMLRQPKQSGSAEGLSGTEDLSVLHSKITFLPSRVSFNEVSKFKRRNRYLEFFVQVAHRALFECNPEQALEWCNETCNWLTKRNESINVPRTLGPVDTRTPDANPSDDKKYVATMLEYNKDNKAGKGNETQGIPKSRAPNKKTKKSKPKWKSSNYTEDPGAAAYEEAVKNAMVTLSVALPEVVRNFLKRRKLRQMCSEELPWRAQMYIIQGMSQFAVFLYETETMEKLTGCSNTYRLSYLDTDWFTLEGSCDLIAGYDGGHGRRVKRQKLRTSTELFSSNITAQKAGMETTADVGGVSSKQNERQSVLEPRGHDNETPYSQRTDDTSRQTRGGKSLITKQSENPQLMSSQTAADMLRTSFDFYKRAVVCSRRGEHWTLLQNACRSMFNCYHDALLRASVSAQNPTGFISLQELRTILWKPLYVATDALLDMLQTMLNDARRLAGKNENECRSYLDDATKLMGGIEDEKGGASLKFDPLDDINTVDLRFVQRFVLRALEILYHQSKWEYMIDVGTRFNVLTNYRYTEKVCPLVVFAQRKLILLIVHDGEKQTAGRIQPNIAAINAPVAHHAYLDKELGGTMAPEQLSQTDHSVNPDCAAREPSFRALAAVRNINVPLDPKQCLDEFRQALNKSRYTARAISHSRRLLLHYLAAQQSGIDGPSGMDVCKVDFIPSTTTPAAVLPHDVVLGKGEAIDNVQVTQLPRSQLYKVMISYINTIELLQAKKQKSLAVQAMKELADLNFHNGNLKEAWRWWSNALDLTVGNMDVIGSWRRHVDVRADVSRQLLDRCGLWGCVLAGVLSVNIARYVITLDLGKRTETCLLAGHFLKAVFRATMAHPIVDRQYADYDIGEGCEVITLIPGMDLLSDKFRVDGRTMIEALRWLNDELADARQHVFVLPLLTLYQYFTTFVCRDVHRSVSGRILRVRVLTDLSLFSEAVNTLLLLLHGERLPHPSYNSYRQPESTCTNIRFNTSKPISYWPNRKMLSKLCEKRLSLSLSALYGPVLTSQVSVAQAHLMIAIAHCLPVIPTEMGGVLFEAPCAVGGKTDSIENLLVPKPKAQQLEKLLHRASIRSQKGTDEGYTGLSDDPESVLGADEPQTVQMLKTVLLSTAAELVTNISQCLLQSTDSEEVIGGLQPAEMEVVIRCKIELAAISHQYHHATMASRIMMSALRTLQLVEKYDQQRDSKSTTASGKARKINLETRLPSVGKPENNLYNFHNIQASTRLDARLWLTCRLWLVKYMLDEIRCMDDTKGPDSPVMELSDCRAFCIEGIAECEALGEKELLAEFVVQAALLDLLQGRADNSTRIALTQTLELLFELTSPSESARLLIVFTCILVVDLRASMETVSTEPALRQMFQKYKQAQTVLLEQLREMGEAIEHYRQADDTSPEKSYLDCPVSPIQNLYLPHIHLLTQLKFRIGCTMARIVAVSVDGLDKEAAITQWVKSLGVLNTALELSKVSISRYANLEADILLNIGKVERQLYRLGRYTQKTVLRTFVQAIKLSFSYDHDLSLIRQSYLEMALTYLDECPPGGVAVSRQTAAADSAGSKKDLKNKVVKSDVSERERLSVWTCIRAAAASGQAQRMRKLIQGDPYVTSQPVQQTITQDIPLFALFDLLGSQVLGRKKKIFQSEIEEELSTMPECQENPKMETYIGQIRKVREAAQDMSWVSLLGYQKVVTRICSAASVSSALITETENYLDNKFVDDDHKMAAGYRFDVVRTPLYANQWALRLSYLHAFFVQNLETYAVGCCAVYPPNLAEPALKDEPALTGDIAIPCTRYEGNKTVAELQGDDSAPRETPPPGVNYKVVRPSDEPVVQPSVQELSLQWYRPSHQNISETDTDGSTNDERILLLYALNKKAERGSRQVSGLISSRCVFFMDKLENLYARISSVTEKAELSLADGKPRTTGVSRQRSGLNVAQSTSKIKQQRIKPLSPRPYKDDHLEVNMRQCIADIRLFLGLSERAEASDGMAEKESEAEVKLPFELNKTNLTNLERLFNSAYGYTLKGTDLVTWLNTMFPLP